MGNKASSVVGSPTPDDDSIRSIVRKPMRKERKSSNNLFKRIDSKSPLPRPTTATTLVFTERETSSEVDISHSGCSPIKVFDDAPHSARTPPLMMRALHSTISDDSGDRPPSPSETIKDSKTFGSSEWSDVARSASDDIQSSPLLHRSSVLSPTIPAPSPLPEDSPHKYGLKDYAENSEPMISHPPEDSEANKNQRRGSGFSIFQGAKTLQSASSFLNGLSTARRRAESHSRMNDASSWSHLPRPGSRPRSRAASRGPVTRPASAAHLRGNKAADNESRRLGHNFKSNGFAYARALDITQLKCYTTHAKLHSSSNKHASVECSVCHMDDDDEHWTCTWCAIRMCRYCRREFGEAGLSALRERIRMAELGRAALDGGEESEGEELFGPGRGRC